MANSIPFRLDRSAPGSLVENLKAEILRHARAGWLRPGDRLPPTRALAERLGVNRGTVTAAYDELRREGVLVGHVGRGTFLARDFDPGKASTLPHAARGFRWADHLAGFAPPPEDEWPSPVAGAEDSISFASNIPDASLFPVEAFRRALNEALAARGGALLGYGAPEGQPAFRRFLLRTLAEQHRVAVRDEELLVVNGSQQALDLIARAFLRPGDTVLVEEPTYCGALDLLRGHGARLVGVPVDENGVQAEALETVLARERPKLVYLMPTFQNPTGWCLSPERRERIVRLAARYEVPVVEDDFDGELYFHEPPPPPLKSHPGSESVLYIGTPSKTLFPGLRIGWIAAAEPVVRRLSAIRRIADLSGSPLLQEALARFGESGGFPKHRNLVREVYARRMKILETALERTMPPGVTWTRPRGGLSLLLTLPPGLDSDRLLPEAAEAGVLFAPGRRFFLGDGARHLRLSFGSVASERVEEGVERLAGVVHRALERRAEPVSRGRGEPIPPV